MKWMRIGLMSVLALTVALVVAFGVGPAEAQSPSLTVSNVSFYGATLSLAGHSADWYYRQTSPSTGTCTYRPAATRSVTLRLSPNTNYTYRAYSNFDCSTVLATVTFTTTPPTLTASSVTTNTFILDITNYTGTYYVRTTKPASTTCNRHTSGTRTAIAGLTSGTSYSFRGYTDSNCSTALTATLTFTTLKLRLFPHSLSSTSAAIQLTGTYSGNWYYRRSAPSPQGNCTWAGGTVVQLRRLTPATPYTFQAYSNSGCVTLIAAVSFNTQYGLRVVEARDTTARVEILGSIGSVWYYNLVGTTDCIAVRGGQRIANLTGLEADRRYSFRAYSDSDCATWLATIPFTTMTPSVDVNVTSIGFTTAILTLASPWTGSGPWYYQMSTVQGRIPVPSIRDAAGGCSSRGAQQTSAEISGLREGLVYQFAVYSAEGCASSDEVGETDPFTTKGIATSVAGTVATTTLSNYNDDAYYRLVSAACETGDSTEMHRCRRILGYTNPDFCVALTSPLTLRDLTLGRTYSIVVYEDSACSSTPLHTHEFVVSGDVTVMHSDVSFDRATLTVGGHSEAWYYKQTAPEAGSCRYVSAGTSTATVTGLEASTAYTFGIYSDSQCSVYLAAPNLETSFSTIAMPGLTVSDVNNTGATLTLSDAVGMSWSYQQRAPTIGMCTTVPGTSVELMGLTPNLPYRFAAYLHDTDNPCSEKLSEVSFVTVLTVSLRVEDLRETTATLRIRNHDEAWYYKQEPGGTCESVSAGQETVALTGLTAGTDYEYKAYSDGSCTTEIASQTFTTIAATPAPSPGSFTDFPNLEDSGTGNPSGICTNGTHMWVADYSDAVIRAYLVRDKSRVPDRDLDQLRAAGNRYPDGIFCDSETVWVMDTNPAMIFAYDIRTGERDTSKEFTNDDLGGVYSGSSLWMDSAGTYMWVVLRPSRGPNWVIRAFEVSSKRPAILQDPLVSSDGELVTSTPSGIAGQANLLLILNTADDMIHAYTNCDGGYVISEGLSIDLQPTDRDANSPNDVAVYGGKIWVSDSNLDELLVFDVMPASC